jgi:glucose-6-phosphate 1-dehydrogenase
MTSAETLVRGIRAHFAEDQVYRIDHYLAKEMVQNMIVFRQSNALFRRTWNKDFIERIEIIASEAIGIEGRATFYEQTGALRDVVQSHLLQLAAVTLMDAPAAENWPAIPQERLRALQQLRLAPGAVTDAVIRGQYHSYKTEVANPHSAVETFVSLTLESTDPAWRGVPITLVTGKALHRKTTEVRLQYRDSDTNEANRLVLHIQPDEGAEIDLWTKEPGYEHKRKRHSLHFSYGEHYTTLPEAYERVLVDAMRSDHSLFTSSDEVLASWRILAPVQAAWDMSSDDLITYETGADPLSMTQGSHASTNRP